METENAALFLEGNWKKLVEIFAENFVTQGSPFHMIQEKSFFRLSKFSDFLKIHLYPSHDLVFDNNEKLKEALL